MGVANDDVSHGVGALGGMQSFVRVAVLEGWGCDFWGRFAWLRTPEREVHGCIGLRSSLEKSRVDF